MAAVTVGGNGHSTYLLFTKPPTRTVSLVPSITQSLIDLDCGHTLVGVTEYCPSVEGRPLAEIVGGTHDIDIDMVLKLQPELVLANQEENDKSDIESLEAAGLKVWVSFPKTVEEAIQVLWAMARIFGVMKEATPKIMLIERSLEWVQRGTSNSDVKTVFVPIWQEKFEHKGTYWMTFNEETYCDSVLSTCGGYNVFRKRRRRFPLQAEFEQQLGEDPGERDTRYPRVDPEEVVQASPELILLPDEPFNFSKEDELKIEELLSATPAVMEGKVFRVDGRWLSWHGTMLAHALAELPTFFGY